MRTPVRNNAFARYTNQVYGRRDPYDRCPVCGEAIYWPEEGFLDRDGRMYHEKCAEKGCTNESENLQQ